MKQTVYFLRGLPASGKSTWAKEYVLKNPNTDRINKDDLRQMLHAGKHSKGNENTVNEFKRHLIRISLTSGRNVIIDDTNFFPRHLEEVSEIVDEYRKDGYEIDFIVKDFNTPLKECIARDAARPNPVGEKVIRTMYNQYLKKEIVRQEDNSKNFCVIFDIDGTIAKMVNRSPYDWDKVGTDLPKQRVIDLVRLLNNTYNIVFLSGRDEICYEKTRKWLLDHVGFCDELYMRKNNDNRADNIIKLELMNKYVLPTYNVFAIFDDRQQVVDMWREQGFQVYQVDEGNF